MHARGDLAQEHEHPHEHRQHHDGDASDDGQGVAHGNRDPLGFFTQAIIGPLQLNLAFASFGQLGFKCGALFLG